MNNMIKEKNKLSEIVSRKFVNSYKLSDYEILTDSGFTDVNFLHETIEYEIYNLKLSDGSELKCADDHIVFYNDFTEVFVKDLSIGDRILVDGGESIVIECNPTGEFETMFDFQLSEYSNKRYYTNNILSHNTHLAKTLAKYMFDSEDSMIRLDMSEFSEKISMSRILGSAPGYVGYESGSSFLNSVRTKPYSVILLDEVEKAHSDVMNIFLQLFDDGHLTDSHGRQVDFKNTVIIMTSNVGVRKLSEFGTGVGFGTSAKSENKELDKQAVIDSELKKKFAPEFLNRIDNIIMFNSLDKENIGKIADLELVKIFDRINTIEYSLELDSTMKDHIISVGYDEKYGARPMKRSIQTWIEDPITEKILEDNPPKGSTLILSYDSETKEAIIKVSVPLEDNSKETKGKKK